MGALVRGHDWASTPLGAPDGWPPCLRHSLPVCLNAGTLSALFWGPDHLLLPNDRCRPVLREPEAALAKPARDAFGTAWDMLGPELERVLESGRGLEKQGLRLDGAETGGWWNIGIAPILDHDGTVAGLWLHGVESTSHSHALERSRAAEERYSLALAAGGGLGAWDWDVERDTVVSDARFARMYGVDPAKAAEGVPMSEFFRCIHPQDLPRIKSAIRHSIETGEGFAEDYRLVLGEREIWIAARGQPHYDEAGKPIRFPGVSFDITAGRQTEQALKDSEIRYRALFDAIDEGFCIIEFLDGPHGPLSDYIHIEANPAYAVHAGIPNVVGQKLRDMVPDEAEGWLELYGGVLRTGNPIRFERELVATGRYLELAAFRIEPASRRQVAVLFQDITARKRAEAELRRLNDTLEARVATALAERKILADAVEGMAASVHVVDSDLRWLAINGAATREWERLFGLRPQVGDRLPDLLAAQPEQREALLELWHRALAGEEYVQVLQLGDRRSRHYEMRFSALRDATGQQIGAIQFAYDVTERLAEQERLRSAEAALRQSQKMEAVGQLTGGIAHDFNNLLTGISGSLELLGNRISQGRYKDVGLFVEAAQGAARRAASLTHRLLAFSRRQTLDPKPTDANRLVAGMEELIRRTVGPEITLEVVKAGGLWPTLVDPPQLENALLNLCINARDAMPEGGRLTIETANRWLDARTARERELEPGQYISLCVSDTGTGMTPDVIAKAFDPFFTTKPIGQGTGLGLSMIYGFARQSNGQVRIYSEVGQGTLVCLYLPRYVGELDSGDAMPEAGQAPRAEAGETVLIVDDEPTVRMLVTEVLEELGYSAIEAADGAAGLKVLQSDARVDLLITDVGLPGGLNGRQVADAARVVRPGLKVLFITGYAENAVVGNGHLEAGMHVLTKPFTMETLAARIRELISGG
ncbi:PAS domain-containing protein [Acetobacteraceae bacterium H6797]|nr:PAS domain-containing protein [Acetobacteraceae bacterium H6797]